MTSEITPTERDRVAALAVLTRVIHLLEHVADRCLTLLASGDRRSPEDAFALSDLGLGATIAASRARTLLPDDAPSHQTSGVSDDPVEVLRQAEAMIRTVPIDGLPAGSSALIAALHALVREHG